MAVILELRAAFIPFLDYSWFFTSGLRDFYSGTINGYWGSASGFEFFIDFWSSDVSCCEPDVGDYTCLWNMKVRFPSRWTWSRSGTDLGFSASMSEETEGELDPCSCLLLIRLFDEFSLLSCFGLFEAVFCKWFSNFWHAV